MKAAFSQRAFSRRYKPDLPTEDPATAGRQASLHLPGGGQAFEPGLKPCNSVTGGVLQREKHAAPRTKSPGLPPGTACSASGKRTTSISE